MGKFREWTVRQCQIAAAMYAKLTSEYGAHERFVYLIAKEIGRSEQGVHWRWRKYGHNFGEDFAVGSMRKRLDREQRRRRKSGNYQVNHQAEPRMTIPAAVLADRDRRYQLELTTTTALLCGDPLPGYSALDKQRS